MTVLFILLYDVEDVIILLIGFSLFLHFFVISIRGS